MRTGCWSASAPGCSRLAWLDRGGEATIPWPLVTVFSSSNSSAKEGPDLGLLLSNVEAWQDRFCRVTTHLQDLNGFGL